MNSGLDFIQNAIDDAIAADDATTTKEATPIEIKVETSLREEIANLRAAIDREDTLAFDLQGKLAKLAKKDTAKANEEYDRLQATLTTAINRGVALSERLHSINTPEELERRVNDRLRKNERIEKMTSSVKKNATPKVTAESQGFPAAYLAPNGNFKPGLDARAKSDLVSAVLGLDAPDALHKFSKADAEKLIKARGWEGFVAKKQATLAAKAERDAAKAAEKKSAVKKTTAAKKTTSATKPQAKPDPKPAPRTRQATRRSGRKTSAAK